MRRVNAVLVIIKTLTVRLVDKDPQSLPLIGTVDARKRGHRNFMVSAEVDMGLYSQEPSEAERDRKIKKKRYWTIPERCIVCKVCFKRMKDS